MSARQGSKQLGKVGKAVKATVRMTIAAGKAAPSPPVGPRLGQLGANIMQFCKDFNAATADYVEGVPVTTTITAYEDRSVDFSFCSPPVSFLLKQVAGVAKGTAEPGRVMVGSVPIQAVYEIARIKQQDEHLRHVPLEGLCKSILGTATTCGLQVLFDRDYKIGSPPDNV
uniref:Large ribosomal subunit protein uL11m n=1 Tax=Compsopogon caeruleus TaxID=31354 RepID=A0A7S1T4C2_9RHOD|mmetsp:Transcript_10166/g.20531  ORF Transcript_10166/g.20531 Transcript_10166/m.20531 type:complete len:170 (+) Transcript_10166:117-626(+)